MKVVPINKICDFDFGLDPFHDRMKDMQDEMVRNLSQKREDQIIEALKKRGYEFQSKEQLYEFAKRCELRSYEDRPELKELWYENEIICIWDETITFEHVINKITTTITVRVG